VAGLVVTGGCGVLLGPPAHVPRIGFIAAAVPARDTSDPYFQALLEGLRDYGYVDGQNIQLEHRFPADSSQDSELVTELLRLGMDVLLMSGTVLTQAAQSATSTVPILGIDAGDPLGAGLVSSLSHPGGNVTVISQDAPDTAAKRLELLQQIVPAPARIADLYSTWNPTQLTDLQNLRDAARVLGVELIPAAVSSTNSSDLTPLDHALDAAIADGAQAFVLEPPLGQHEGYKRIAARLKDLHLASIASQSDLPQVGGLAAYGANVPALYRRAGYFVDRVLKGTSPADLPVEFPTVWDVVINRSTAEAIGVTIPPEVALQVTEWVP
jgi:putative ABC transport system substrate-binding protein